MALALSDIDDAIAKVLRGQSYTANGYTYTRASLQQLYDLRTRLQQEQGVDGTGRTMFARGRLFTGGSNI